MKITDAHCHLANLSELMPLEPLLAEAETNGITRWFSSALRKNEVAYHLDHSDPRILFSAGIHPNFEECDLNLQLIADLCKTRQIWAIGEIGLDKGNPELAVQRKMFNLQLELAREHCLPVILHLVGHINEAYQTLKQYPLVYLVHGYAGSDEGFRELNRLNSYFTISSRLLQAEKQSLLIAMLRSGRYLFETDITQYYVQGGESNPLLRLLDLVDKCAMVSGIPKAELLIKQEHNANQLLTQ